MEPRGLSIQEAAEYCGITVAAYRTWMREGRVPRPWPGTRRVDRHELDDALDRMSGRTTNQSISKYDAWKAQKAAV